MSEQDREVSTTRNWGIGIIFAMLIQASAVVYWAAGVEADVNENTRNIAALRTEVGAVEYDIRTILIGIEQVKARLGIVENN